MKKAELVALAEAQYVRSSVPRSAAAHGQRSDLRSPPP